MDLRIFDIHSHLLPGVDDGSESLEQSLRLLGELEAIGVTDVVLTPHFSRRKGFTLPAAEILQRFADFCACCGDVGAELYPGCEAEYSQDLPDCIRGGLVAGLAGTDRILVEFHPMAEYRDVLSAVRSIFAAGRRPVIAHAERYARISTEQLGELKKIGAEIQVNLTSFLSRVPYIKKNIKLIIKARLADYAGTDTHSRVPGRAEVQKTIRRIMRMTDHNYTERLLYSRAAELIKGEQAR